MPQESLTDLPELYQMREQLQADRRQLPGIRAQAIRGAGWRLLGAASWLMGVVTFPDHRDAEAPYAFLWGAAWGCWCLGCAYQLILAWENMQAYHRLDAHSRRILARVNQEIQERL